MVQKEKLEAAQQQPMLMQMEEPSREAQEGFALHWSNEHALNASA